MGGLSSHDSQRNEHVPLQHSATGLHYRLLNKDGRPTIRLHPLRLGACWGYVRDIWSTLVDLRWRYMLLIFTGTFILSWVIFALLWYLLAYAHGDLQPGQPHNHTACVHSINSMRAAFSFAVETQLTIGYGTMYPSGECPLAVALLTMHMILGLMLEAFITGVFVAKLARPKLRSESLRFSRNAVLCKVGERGPMSLVIRVANLRSITQCPARGRLIRQQDGRPHHAPCHPSLPSRWHVLCRVSILPLPPDLLPQSH
uniref:Potassium inwardly rectifying channel subfamily J member 13 n=1 Tax=Eptatretus burgeri TaxID=7764 RepID=A0A8C4QP74_EPTBU